MDVHTNISPKFLLFVHLINFTRVLVVINLWNRKLRVINVLFIYFFIVMVVVVVGEVVMYNIRVWPMVYMDTFRDWFNTLFMGMMAVSMRMNLVGVTVMRVLLASMVFMNMVLVTMMPLVGVYIPVVWDWIVGIYFNKLLYVRLGMNMNVVMVLVWGGVNHRWRLVTLPAHAAITQKV